MRTFISILLALLIVLGIWFGITYYIHYRFPIESGAMNPGTLGDSFGAVNSLFTSLAFLLLIYTAHLQRLDLKKQSEELELSRKEFVINRTTNLIYNQIRRIDEEIARVSVDYYWINLKRTVTGLEALSYLANNISSIGLDEQSRITILSNTLTNLFMLIDRSSELVVSTINGISDLSDEEADLLESTLRNNIPEDVFVLSRRLYPIFYGADGIGRTEPSDEIGSSNPVMLASMIAHMIGRFELKPFESND